MAGSLDPLRDRRAHVSESEDSDADQPNTQPPSTFRLTPLTPLLRSRNRAASVTSSIVIARPVGVRFTTASIIAALSFQAGLSPTIPGCNAFTRTGASSSAKVRTIVSTAPLTLVTVVEPG